MSRLQHWDAVKQDIHFGVRQLLRRPALPAMVVFLLALGIGVNTAIFSVVKPVLLEPLPFDSPGQLMMVWESDFRYSRIPVAGSNFLDWREQSRAFQQLVCYTPQQVSLSGDGEPERLHGTLVTVGMFELLGIRPTLGRTFLPEEERAGSPDVAILSDALWKRRYGGDPNIIGQTIRLGGKSHTVVGIMPPGFTHPDPWSVGEPSDVWTPLSLADLTEYGRSGHQFLVLGRLEDGVTIEAAQAEMDAISGRLEEAYPDTNEDAGATLVPVHEQLVGRAGGQLMMLLGAAGLVLLIVCANVAGLLVAKASTRQTEVAIRSSMGASRARLVRQFLTENLPLFLIAGGSSVVLAMWGVQVLRAMIPTDIPRVEEIGIDAWVLAFTLGVSLLAGFVFGLVPALTASRINLSDTLRQGRGATRGGRARVRNILVVTQFALALVLANGAALMLQSYMQLRNMDHGFSTEGVLTMRLSLQGPRYEGAEQVHAFYEEVLEGIEALPGVRQAAAISRLPLEGGTNTTAFIEGSDIDFGQSGGPLAEIRVITPDYFESMGTPLLAGRKLNRGDGSQDERGAIINRTMARRAWPDEDPIGKRFALDPPNWMTVVGVVGDTRQWGLEYEPISEVFLPYAPAVTSGMFSFRNVRFLVIRTDTDPMGLVAAVKQKVFEIDSDQPVSEIRTTRDILASSIARRRFNTTLIGMFAGIALVLVAAGIYGVMSYFVIQRNHEIGVRMALGADRTRVLKLVLGQGLKLAAAGVVLGLAGVAASTRLMESMLYGMSPTDPLTVVGGTLFLVAVGLLGSLMPARRATRVAPVTALRDE